MFPNLRAIVILGNVLFYTLQLLQVRGVAQVVLIRMEPAVDYDAEEASGEIAYVEEEPPERIQFRTAWKCEVEVALNSEHSRYLKDKS